MARRLLSLPTDDEAGPRIGGSGTEVRIYDDAALSVLSTTYAEETGAATVPNPIIPNAGFQTDLTVATLTTDTVITVREVSGFAVGNLVPIYNGTTTTYRAITAINAGTKQLTLASAIGVAYAVGPTLVGNPDMVGHVHAWLDDARDYYLQTKDVSSTRVLPPVSIPVRIPATTLAFQEEGVSTGVGRATLNLIGTGFTAVDDVPNVRVNLTHGNLDAHGGTITDAGHGTRTTAAAHAYSHITGTHGDSAHAAVYASEDDVKKWALVA